MTWIEINDSVFVNTDHVISVKLLKAADGALRWYFGLDKQVEYSMGFKTKDEAYKWILDRLMSHD